MVSFRETNGVICECSQAENAKKQCGCSLFKKGTMNKCYNLRFDQFCILCEKQRMEQIQFDLLSDFESEEGEEE